MESIQDNPTVHRLKELVAQKPTTFSLKERELVSQCAAFGASDKQQAWLDRILGNHEPDAVRRATSIQQDFDALDACEDCSSTGMLIMTRALVKGDKSSRLMKLGRYAALPLSQQRRDAAFYCLCQRGQMMMSWQDGHRDERDAWTAGWRRKEEFALTK